MRTKSQECGESKGCSSQWSGEVDALADSEKADLAEAVADSQESASEYDLTRLANTVEGYAPAKLHCKVRPRYGTDLRPRGSFIMGLGSRKLGVSPSFNVVLTKGFYLGKYEVKQEEYLKATRTNPSKLKSSKYPVENIT